MPPRVASRWTARDEEMARLLMGLGLTRASARALVFLGEVEEALSAEVEAATGLRQPEVSVAMHALRRREWVSKRDVKHEGKGRPRHSYRLEVPLPAVVDAIEAEKRAALARDLAGVARLRELWNGR